jgi:uncharacterized protein YlaI
MRVRYKPSGSWFGVVLRTSQFSYGKIAVGGAVGGKATFPTPDLGSSCVCCDRADAPSRRFDASTDRLRVDPIAIPVCSECDGHVAKSTNAAQMVAALLCVGGGGCLWGLMKPLAWAALGGAVLVACCVAWLVAVRAARRRSARDGHFTGFEIMASFHQCSVRTTNPRLARELLDRNREQVFRTTQPEQGEAR